MRILRLVLCFIFVTSSMSTTAQVLTVTNSPRAFSVATPTSWLLRPVSTGNSRIKFSSPSGTPSAECSVISKEFAGLSGLPQEYFDSIILKQTSAAERTDQLAARYKVWFGLSVVGAQAGPLTKPIVLFRFGRTKYRSLPQTSEYYEFPIRQRLILENI